MFQQHLCIINPCFDSRIFNHKRNWFIVFYFSKSFLHPSQASTTILNKNEIVSGIFFSIAGIISDLKCFKYTVLSTFNLLFQQKAEETLYFALWKETLARLMTVYRWSITINVMSNRYAMTFNVKEKGSNLAFWLTTSTSFLCQSFVLLRSVI